MEAYSTTELKNNYGFENPFQPDDLAVKALPYLKDKKQLLDIGCGEGADSVFYARNGFTVIAIDNNEIYLNRLQKFTGDNPLLNISIQFSDAVAYEYPSEFYDVINCLLVGCCMKRSEFEKLVPRIKQAVKPDGVVIMSLRNYLDPDLKEYLGVEKMIEPNTFLNKEDCCKVKYFIEKDRLREHFTDFEILFYYEGLAPDKYALDPEHGDSYIICKNKN